MVIWRLKILMMAILPIGALTVAKILTLTMIGKKYA
jgi:hypothetical protein